MDKSEEKVEILMKLENFKEKTKKFLPLISIFGLALFFILLHWSNFNVPFNRDEGEYAYSAWILRNGELPYENSFLQKPPMIIYTYYLAQAISPSYWPPKILSYLSVFGTAILLFFIISKDFGKRAGLIAVWFIPLLVVLPGFDQFAANTEMFMIFPLIGVLALYVLNREKNSSCPWFLGGVLGAAAVLYKYNVFPILIFIFSVWAVKLWFQAGTTRTAKNISFGFFGFFLASLLILSPFLIHDSGKALWECTVKFNKYYSGSNIFGFSGFWNHLGLFFVKRPKNWWFFASLLFLALLTTFGSWYGHYYIVFVLFLSVIIAYSVDFLADLVSQKFSFSVSEGENTKKEKLNPAKVRIFLTAALIFITMIPSAELIFSSKEEFSKAKLGGENTFLNSVSASQEIKNMTDSGDYVLVAGSEPQILYYSKRKSPTRFVIFYPLMIDTPLSSDYQKEVIEEIKKNPPKIIAYVNSYYSWTPDPNSPKIIIEFLDGLIKEKYYLIEGNSKENQISIYKIK